MGLYFVLVAVNVGGELKVLLVIVLVGVSVCLSQAVLRDREGKVWELGFECPRVSASSESGCVLAEEKAGCCLLLHAQPGCEQPHPDSQGEPHEPV